MRRDCESDKTGESPLRLLQKKQMGSAGGLVMAPFKEAAGRSKAV